MEQELTGFFYTAFFVILLTAVIAFSVLFVIAEWRILTKAGEKGWKSLIPFYSIFVSHHIVGMHHAWFIAEVITWVTELVFEMVRFPEPVVVVFGIAVLIFTLLSEAIHIIKMCNCFGKGTGFKIGMLLLPGLFLLIIAYGKAEYQKPEH